MDSVLDEDGVIEAQWCERQVLQNVYIDGEILFYSCDSGSTEGRCFMSSSCNFTKEKVLLELTLLFDTDDSIVSHFTYYSL